MLKRFLDNWPYKLAAVIIAIMLRFYVSAQLNPHETKEFPVTVVHVPEGYYERDATPSVNLVLSGMANALDDMRPTDITAMVDASNAHSGRNSGLPIMVSVAPELRDRITVDSKSPATASLTLEPLLTVRRPVHVLFTHTAAAGYTYGQAVVSPAAAKVTAPESLVSSIRDLVVDVDAQMDESQSSGAGPIDGSYEIVARDDVGRRVNGVSVLPVRAHVQIPIIRVASVKTVPIAPTIVGRPKAPLAVTGALADPSFVTLSGPADELAKISVVMTSPIDVAGSSANLRRTTTLELPAGVTASTSKNATITVSIGTLSSAPAAISASPKPVGH